MNNALTPIGYIQSPFKEKFAVPRQPGLAPSAIASISLCGKANHEDSVRGLEQFSHIWVLFLFSENQEKGWTPTVRPPRLGGNTRMGVFASRATFRPNGVGMSVVSLNAVRVEKGHVVIDIGSCDLIDGTPIIDIKPYIPYSDALPHARAGYASHPPKTLNVTFTDAASRAISKRENSAHKMQVIKEVLAQDPRPAYKKEKPDHKTYAVHLFDMNVKFTVKADLITVTAIETASDKDRDYTQKT